MKKELKLKVEALLENFEDTRLQLSEFLEENGIPLKTIMKFEIIFEELFVNVCHYAYEETGFIECICTIDDGVIELILIDSGKEFDPFARENPDINAPIEERPIGGLGIYMVKKNSDTYEYEYQDGENIVKITLKRK